MLSLDGWENPNARIQKGKNGWMKNGPDQRNRPRDGRETGNE